MKKIAIIVLALAGCDREPEASTATVYWSEPLKPKPIMRGHEVLHYVCRDTNLRVKEAWQCGRIGGVDLTPRDRDGKPLEIEP